MKRSALLLCAVFFAASAWAQDPTTGFPPYGSFENGRFDAVNRQNLNVNFALPIVALPGRGMDFRFAVVYDSLIWTRVTSGGTTTWSPVTDPNGTPTWGWKKTSAIGATSYTSRTTSRLKQCTPFPDLSYGTTITQTWNNYVYRDPLGTPHSFGVYHSVTTDGCDGTTTTTEVLTGYASDGSGYYIDISSLTAPVVTAPAGVGQTQVIQVDPNGNQISAATIGLNESDWKDTANHTALRIISTGSTTEYHYLDTSGTDRVITLNLQSFNIKTKFGCAGVVEYTGTASLPTSLVLPNGQQYQFTYEVNSAFHTYKTGRLLRVTLPTGGYYEYQYPATPNNGISCSDAGVNSLTRVMSDGSSQAQWQFTRTPNGSGWIATVTAPQLPYDSAANQSVFTFDASGHETSLKIYQGSASTGILKRTSNTAWAANGTPATRTLILEDNTQSQTETTFDSNGNLLVMKEHDWGSGAPGAVVRTTNFTYLADPPYVARNILNRLKQVTVSDSTGTVKSRTDIAYDGSAFTVPNCITGVAQHDDTNYGCTFTVRGNPTSVTTYTDPITPGGAVTKTFTYDSLGNLRQADLNCCQQEQWVYSPITNYAYPDSAGECPGFRWRLSGGSQTQFV